MANEEMFDVLGMNGRATGRCARQREIYERGLWHGVANLCVTDGAGNVFQQRRGRLPHIRNLPDLWDLFFVTGPIQAGESPTAAIVRELQQIGVKHSLNDFLRRAPFFVGLTRSDYWVEDPSFPDGGYHYRAIDHSFVVELPGLKLGSLSLKFPRVIAVRKHPVKELEKALNRPFSAACRELVHRPDDDDKLYATVLDAVKRFTP